MFNKTKNIGDYTSLFLKYIYITFLFFLICCFVFSFFCCLFAVSGVGGDASGVGGDPVALCEEVEKTNYKNMNAKHV